jgi:hypothetical protein
MERLIALIAIALLVVVGAQAVDQSVRATNPVTTVENESFVPDGGNVTALDDSELANAQYNSTADVYVNDSGTTVAVNSSGNYTWIQDNGTVRTTDQSYLDGFSSANTTYGYVTVSDRQRGLATAIAGVMGAAQWLVLVLGVGLVFMAVRVMA